MKQTIKVTTSADITNTINTLNNANLNITNNLKSAMDNLVNNLVLGSDVTYSTLNSANLNVSARNSLKGQQNKDLIGSNNSNYVSSHTNDTVYFKQTSDLYEGLNDFSVATNANTYQGFDSNAYSVNVNLYKQKVNLNVLMGKTYYAYGKINVYTDSFNQTYTLLPAGGDYSDNRDFELVHNSFVKNLNIADYNAHAYRPVYQTNVDFKKSNLPFFRAEYDPTDWALNTEPDFDVYEYLTNINSNLNKINLGISCSKILCVTIVYPLDDGIKNNDNYTQRVYVDVILRKNAFLNYNVLEPSQRKCLIEQFLTQNLDRMNQDQLSYNLYAKCNVPSQYDIVPLTKRCVKSIVKTCNNGKFLDLVYRVAPFVPSDGSHYIPNTMTNCLNVTSNSNETDKVNCGENIYDSLLLNGFKLNFASLVGPLSSTQFKENSNFNLLQQNSTNNSELNQTQKDNVDNVNSYSDSKASKDEKIDGSSQSQPASVSDSDRQKVNSEPDAAVDSYRQSNNSVYLTLSTLSTLFLIVILI